MEEARRNRISRRDVLKLGAAAGTAAAAMASFPKASMAHDLTPKDPLYQWAKYEEIVNRPTTMRQLYQWPNLLNPLIFGNIRNGMNGFQ